MELFKVCSEPPLKGAEGMYLRVSSGNIDLEDGAHVLAPNSEVSTDTYFNIFSSSKYSEYTRAEEISITTIVSGNLDVELRLLSSTGETTVEKRKVDSENPVELTFNFGINGLDDKEPVCHYLIYLSHDESSIHSFGSYTSDIEPDAVDMGIVICTFKREERVIRTLDRIDKVISDGKFGPHGKITVYVIDNARTLDIDSIKYENIKLIPNSNNGGSGGFAKGMIESHKNMATHILLMDDDIDIDPNVISKTFNLVSILNNRHKEAFILGGMLLPELPCVQYEAGAERTPIFKGGKHGLDFSKTDDLLNNDKREPAQYGGWWYMCMPSSAAEKLPLPMFIKLDDVIFGIRRMKDHIVMNGIGVWHDSFESKANPITEFYFLRRNTFIFNSIFNLKDGLGVGTDHLRKMLHCIKEGKSDEYYFTRLAARDFLKGPRFLIDDNTEEIFNLKGPERSLEKEGNVIGRILRNSSAKELPSLLFESLSIILKWNKISRNYRDSVEYLSSYEFRENRQ